MPGSRPRSARPLPNRISPDVGRSETVLQDAAAALLIDRSPLLLRPDSSRVVLRPFAPANNPLPADPAASERWDRVMRRVFSLNREKLEEALRMVKQGLGDRHPDVDRVLQRRYTEVSDPSANRDAVTPEQAQLIGAYFTEEYSFQAAALFNPSIVVHPDQAGAPPGSVRFILSLRAVGEGHISSVTFRTGYFSGSEGFSIDPANRWAVAPRVEHIPGGAQDDLGSRLFYPAKGDPSEIVIFPVTQAQRHGIEDLRLVRFVDDDGQTSYFGTYTAFSGEAIRQELLRTLDFETFDLNALRGTACLTKGMALFPRRIDGRYAMIGRRDHENLWLMKSNDLYEWGDGTLILSPQYLWEFVQIGNCGSPIEIDEGWLLLTHGVGPVRSYCIGACLLDKRDPGKVLARLRQPLVSPGPETRDGYVPNVVYSCGAIVHDRTLILPYGVADSVTAFASVPVQRLLDAME